MDTNDFDLLSHCHPLFPVEEEGTRRLIMNSPRSTTQRSKFNMNYHDAMVSRGQPTLLKRQLAYSSMPLGPCEENSWEVGDTKIQDIVERLAYCWELASPEGSGVPGGEGDAEGVHSHKR